MHKWISYTAAGLVCAVVGLNPVTAAELKILSPGATEGVLSEILPQFERQFGHKVTVTYGPVGGLANRVRQGDGVDVVILSEPEAESLLREGKTVAGSQAVVGKVGIGLFVRKGDPKPDVGTADAFIGALQHAKAIAYADPKLGGSASILVAELMKSLDPSGAIAARTKMVPPAKPLVDLVAAGGIDFGFQPISQIFLDSRIDYAGPLPAQYQQYSKYVMSLVATSRNQDAYKSLVAFLSSPEAAAVRKVKGFESE
jgi:molybdate transport system substrate-binding protein